MVRMNPDALLFGTAGIPLSAKGGGVPDGVEEIKRLGLDCMEVEFVHGVRMKKETAGLVRDVSEETGIHLTVHGPYYINLNAQEEEKYEASIKRIMDSARTGNMIKARSVTFHAAFKMGQPDDIVSEKVKNAVERIVADLKTEGIDTVIAPELTGKPTQWGSIDELVQLCRSIPEVRLCVDFSHYYTRSIGTKNSYRDFEEVLDKIENGLGAEYLQSLHIHASGIAYGPKGEKNHLTLKESDFKYKELLEVLKDRNVKGWLICESPVLEQDALILKNFYHSL